MNQNDLDALNPASESAEDIESALERARAAAALSRARAEALRARLKDEALTLVSKSRRAIAAESQDEEDDADQAIAIAAELQERLEKALEADRIQSLKAARNAIQARIDGHEAQWSEKYTKAADMLRELLEERQSVIDAARLFNRSLAASDNTFKVPFKHLIEATYRVSLLPNENDQMVERALIRAFADIPKQNELSAARLRVADGVRVPRRLGLAVLDD